MYIPAVSWRDEVVLRANWVRNTDCMSQNWRKKLQTTTQAYLQVWKTFVWTLFVCLHLHFILCNWHCLELQLFEPTLCKLFKLNIKNNYWTDCFFRYHILFYFLYMYLFSHLLSPFTCMFVLCLPPSVCIWKVHIHHYAFYDFNFFVTDPIIYSAAVILFFNLI